MPVFQLRVSRQVEYSGAGYVGGNAPTSSDPDSPDGRAKKLNVPGRVRITVLERGSLKVIDSAISKPDGTWRISCLSPKYTFLVIGQDDRGLVNAAVQDWVKPAAMGS